MAEYHPLDVRYKGPSTAYRGSVDKREFKKTDFSGFDKADPLANGDYSLPTKPDATPQPTQPTKAPAKSPWVPTNRKRRPKPQHALTGLAWAINTLATAFAHGIGRIIFAIFVITLLAKFF